MIGEQHRCRIFPEEYFIRIEAIISGTVQTCARFEMVVLRLFENGEKSGGARCIMRALLRRYENGRREDWLSEVDCRKFWRETVDPSLETVKTVDVTFQNRTRTW